MTFTSTPPTVPGFYAWRSKENDFIDLVEVREENISNLSEFLRGEWCRLVSVEEVEKAFREAKICFDNTGYVLKEDWETSRAKQVCDGKEEV